MLKRKFVCVAALMTLAVPALAQLQPQSAHVNLYFPQLADGGTPDNQWQTTLMFMNPNVTTPASIVVQFYNNDGSPLSINFGSGASAQLSLTVPPGGLTIVSSLAGTQTVVGWAIAYATVPVQGLVSYRRYENGRATLEVADQATLPTFSYVSYANRNLGVAVANPYNTASTLLVTVYDSNGNQVGSAVSIDLPAWGHTSFNLNERFPGLSSTFQGTISIDATTTGPRYLVAWTLNVSDAGLLSALPSGRYAWPEDQWDRGYKVFYTMLNQVEADYLVGTVNLDMVATGLVSASTTISGPTSKIQLDYATAQLTADSEAELAFIIGHELGHVIQAWYGLQGFSTNRELDADGISLRLMILAGYDPYAAAGVFGRMQMLSTVPNVLGDILTDPSVSAHTSFSTRIDNVMTTLQVLCSGSSASTCQGYKALIHPDAPGALPLRAPRPSVRK
jgi:hypothetical protein